MYRADQWKVLEVLGKKIPKRPTMKVSDIIETAFSRRENADRVVRNALRRPRAEGHVEIAERGEYRLTQLGASFLAKAKKEGYKPLPARKATKKAAAKKSTKKKVAKKASKKAATKKPVKKPAKKAAKAKSKKAGNGVKAKAEKPKTQKETKGNNKPEEPRRPATSATLSL